MVRVELVNPDGEFDSYWFLPVAFDPEFSRRQRAVMSKENAISRRQILKAIILYISSKPFDKSIVGAAENMLLASADSQGKNGNLGGVRIEQWGYSLPEWFLRNRVHGHTRLSLKWLERPQFHQAAHYFKMMGANVFVRHIKSGDEGAWWPSKVGAVAIETKGRNLAREIIENAHNEGCKIIVYHRHMEDRFMATHNPDWICVDWTGKPVSRNRGLIMCMNSPYSDYFLVRLKELVSMGADGFYFDSIHMPTSGCWCSYCKRKFKQQTGLDHPRNANPLDPLWNKLIDFNNQTIEKTFQGWRQEIHALNPDAVLLISSYLWPAMVDRHLTNRLFRIADSMKTEFSFPLRSSRNSIFRIPASLAPFEKDVKLALGYTLARDAADGRAAHVWIHGLLNEMSAQYATAGMLTYGCIANIDIKETELSASPFKKAFELGNKISPYFAGTRSLRWVALHYSEHLRDKFLANPSVAIKKAIYPVYGAFSALFRAHMPVNIISDNQLEDGNLQEFKLLFLPSRSGLTSAMSSAIKEFSNNGGVIVEQQQTWNWHKQGGQKEASSYFLEQIRKSLRSPPVYIRGGPARMNAGFFLNNSKTRITIAVCNDFSWVHSGRKKPQKNASLPLPCAGVMCVLNNWGTPLNVFEVTTGRALPWKNEGADILIEIPTFQIMAVVVVEFS